eukprot:NODE_726_length_643_cov_165.321705_g717_i0.p1 GENE.NODE_726_length_643_cov_165.321705_g717_i0~~NODE_726_length_643_cov_165.321705_g717_i0.p1  ORF type:complete len:92 (+),score=28.10 NODE_726_length_643_cov_165.321705_g717_i0:41-277(+)
MYSAVSTQSTWAEKIEDVGTQDMVSMGAAKLLSVANDLTPNTNAYLPTGHVLMDSTPPTALTSPTKPSKPMKARSRAT